MYVQIKNTAFLSSYNLPSAPYHLQANTDWKVASGTVSAADAIKI